MISPKTAGRRTNCEPFQVIVRDETEDRTKDAEMTDITPIHHTDTDVSDILRRAGLRPTRQRVSLAEILFSKGDRHVSAELLHEEAVAGEGADVGVFAGFFGSGEGEGGLFAG